MIIETFIARDRLDLVPDLAARLRLEDRMECNALSPEPVSFKIARGIEVSDLAWITCKDGRPSVVYGVVPLPDKGEGWGAVWLLGTPDIENNPVRFHKEALRALGEMRARYPNLTNAADCRNVVHLWWIDRLGFKFTRYHPQLGRFGLPFLEFELTSNV